MRILLVAAPCNGRDVGEAWVAYQWASRLARHHDLTLLTYRKRGAESVVPQLPGVRVVEWVEPPFLGRFERLNSMLKPAYVPFYVNARAWVRNSLAAGAGFDVGLQPVPVAMRYPSPLAGLGVPFVLGPVGGSLEDPPGFAGDDTAPWYVGLRRADRLRMRLDPLLRHTYADARCVIGIAPYVADFLSGVPTQRFEVMSETGLTELPEDVDRSGRQGQPVRLLFVGRVVRTKGTRDAIRAMSLVRDLAVTFDVVGDGFDRGPCEELAKELELGDRVRFHGRLPRDQVDELYRDADVFVFPSYREPGGNVPFEAMGSGLPMICADRGGPASIVDPTCGVTVTPSDPESYARDIARAIRLLVTDPVNRAVMGRAARQRVADIGLWDRKVEAMVRILESVRDGQPGA